MAPKQMEKIMNPPMASSSEEEEEKSGSLGEESDASGDESDSPVEKSKSKKEESLKNPQNRVMSKPRQESSASKIAIKSSDVAALPERSKAKRSLEKAEEMSNNKMKKTSNSEEKLKNSVSGNETPKPTMFQRIFTEDDEIVLRQGILEITATNAKLSENMDAFHELVKDFISFEVTVDQLNTKVRNMRKKFYKTVEKSFEKGITEDKIVFSKVFDQRCFDLSRKIWGVKGERYVGSTSLTSGNEIVSFLKAENLTSFGLDESILIAGWEMVEDGPKKRELEEGLKRIKAMQAVLCMKRIELVADTTKAIVSDNASSSGK